MRALFLGLSLIMALAQQVGAEIATTVAGYQKEIDAILTRYEARWGYASKTQTMRTELEDARVEWALQYTDSWADLRWLDWSQTTHALAVAQRRLDEWRYAVETGTATEDDVEAMLGHGMESVRLLGTYMPLWFDDDLGNAVEMGLWLDMSHAVSTCCADAARYYDGLARAAYDDSIAPDYAFIGQIEFFPKVPESGAVPALPEPDLRGLQLAAEQAFANDERARIRRLIRTAEFMLLLSDDPAKQEMAQILSLTRDRMRFQDAPVGPDLDRVRTLPEGPLRDAVLDRVQDGFLDRAAHMARMLSQAGIGPDERESAATWLLNSAKRLAQLADDGQLNFHRPSGASRLFSALTAASQIMDAAGSGGAKGKELASILQNLADSFPTAVSPVAPFSGPMGAVARQLDGTRTAFNDVAEGMEGVSDLIGGDPAGLERAEAAAERLKEILNPKKMVSRMAGSFVKGLVNTIPFARALFD